MATFVDKTKLQAPPLAIEPLEGLGALDMFGNDSLGDCTCATWAGVFVTDAAVTKRKINFSTSEVITMYRASGYNPNDPSTDQGWSMEAAANYARLVGLRDLHGDLHTIGPWMQVNHVDMTEIQIGRSMFGVMPVGVSLPISAQHQDTWDVGGTGDQTPGSWGGHSLFLDSYDHLGGWFRTWGGLKRFTNAWWNTYVDEAIVKIDPLWCSNTALAPNGFAIADLLAAMGVLR